MRLFAKPTVYCCKFRSGSASKSEQDIASGEILILRKTPIQILDAGSRPLAARLLYLATHPPLIDKLLPLHSCSQAPHAQIIWPCRLLFDVSKVQWHVRIVPVLCSI